MTTKTILDKNISFGNFATFTRCRILANGRAIRVMFSCGARYDIPVSYLLQWSHHPHYVLIHGELNEWEEVTPPPTREDAVVVKCERIVSKTAIRVFFDNDTVYVIPWDTVLMACEPRYEHFGGWTTASKAMVEAWHVDVREQTPETRLYARRLRLYNVKTQTLCRIPRICRWRKTLSRGRIWSQR